MSIRKQYDTDLEALKAALVEMGSNSAEAVEAALEALCTADAEAAQKIVKGDSRINNMERDIEHRCMTLLLRQQPVAGDLRRISTAMKVVTDVERIGDQHLDATEDIRVHLFTREELLELLSTDRIRQALMAAPLWRYFAEHPEP